MKSTLTILTVILMCGVTILQCASLTAAENPLQLSIQLQNDEVHLSWTGGGTLQSAPTATGPWANLPGATSPMVVAAADSQKFFRLNTVLRTRVSSDTFRDVEYHVATGELFFIGEQFHGFDWYNPSQNNYWWCFMNSSGRGSGLLEYLMLNNARAEEMKVTAIANGWTTFTGSAYSFLILEPLTNQTTYVNKTAPSTPGETTTTEAYTDDYREIDNTGLLTLLYRNANNLRIYLGVSGPSVRAAAAEVPPGDGTAENDNGVRADIAYKAHIQLTAEQQKTLLEAFSPVVGIHSDSSAAYFYEHPPGL